MEMGKTGSFDLPQAANRDLYPALARMVAEAERREPGITDAPGWAAAPAKAVMARGKSRATAYRWLARIKGPPGSGPAWEAFERPLDLPVAAPSPPVASGPPAPSPDLPLFTHRPATQAGAAPRMEDPMLPAVKTWTFDDGLKCHPMRTTARDGELWFVLADVCRVLDTGNPSMAAGRLDEDERGISSVETPSGVQDM